MNVNGEAIMWGENAIRRLPFAFTFTNTYPTRLEPVVSCSLTYAPGDHAYVSNFDTPRCDNMDASGVSARGRVKASLAQIAP